MKHDKVEQVSGKVLKSFGLFIVKPAEEAKRIKHPDFRLKAHKHFLLQSQVSSLKKPLRAVLWGAPTNGHSDM